MSSGLILFDTNTLGEISKLGIADAVRRSVRAAGLRPFASEINLIEAVSASPRIHERVVGTLEMICGESSVLPWPGSLLQYSAQAFLRGDREFDVPLSPLRLQASEQEIEKRREQVASSKRALDETHRQLHAEARPLMQASLKKLGIRPRWEELPQFLEYWESIDTRELFAAGTWSNLGLRDPFPAEVLKVADSWRLFSDADAAAVFQGSVAFDQPRQVQRMDLIQLPYLGGTHRRVFVTRDGPFANVCRQVLPRRYHLARVVHFDEFLAGL